MPSPILPGSRSDYRTTTAAFKWIILIVVLGTLALVWVFKKAVTDADDIYRKSGYSDDSLIVTTRKSAQPYIQGNIQIVPPVHQERDEKGNLVTTSFNDGGTKMITIIDARGFKFDVYFDNRLKDGRGLIYLNSYPGENNSMPVEQQTEFQDRILETMK